MPTAETRQAPTIVDLFSGCGGFSLGAHLAGFQSVAALDIDENLQSAYRRNFPRTTAVQASVAEIGPNDWSQLIGRHRPDGVIGGPPCQGFSPIGKRQKDDPRNSLIGHFFRQVAALQPKFFVMENVAGLVNPENRPLLEAGIASLPSRYTVLQPVIVNAASWGAATHRRRVIVVGYDSSEMDPVRDVELGGQIPNATVRDAISDLAEPIPDEGNGGFGWASYRCEATSEYARRLRTAPPPGLGTPEARQRLETGQVSGMFETRHLPRISARYASIEGGKSDPITKSYKLRWDGICPTLRAGTGSDRGAFQAVRPLHPEVGRVITVREAARLQGFPDWFTFHAAKWHSFRMIGNSVSPIVSEHLFDLLSPKLSLRLAA